MTSTNNYIPEPINIADLQQGKLPKCAVQGCTTQNMRVMVPYGGGALCGKHIMDALQMQQKIIEVTVLEKLNQEHGN